MSNPAFDQFRMTISGFLDAVQGTMDSLRDERDELGIRVVDLENAQKLRPVSVLPNRRVLVLDSDNEWQILNPHGLTSSAWDRMAGWLPLPGQSETES